MGWACTRCAAPATSVLSFDYEARRVWLVDYSAPIEKGTGYPLCETHGGRFTPPVGWQLSDQRSVDRPLFATLDVA